MAVHPEKGIGSIAWILKQMKDNPEHKGVTWIRLETEYRVQHPVLRDQIIDMVASGYLKQIGKSGSKFSNYIITSFGHRYLEQHKDDIFPQGSGKPVEKSEEKKFIGDDEVNPSSLLGKKQQAPEEPPVRRFPMIGKEPITIDVKAKNDRVAREKEEVQPVDPTPLYPPKELVQLPTEWCTECLRFIQRNDPKCLAGAHLVTTRPDVFYKNEFEKNHRCTESQGTLTLEPEAIGPVFKSAGQQEFYKVVYELLTEKYAGHITAREIIDRMNR